MTTLGGSAKKQSDKIVFVTGAGRGIGREIALKLASEGYLVCGCARSLDDLKETQATASGAIQIASVDVRKAAALEEWLESEIKAAAGARPWGLVTAAGIHGDINPFVDSNWEEWTKALEVNLYGTALATKFFAKKLLSLGLPGRIALLSGGGATQPMERLSAYSASKAAVVRFGETLALELKPHGITVNAIAPGAVNTAITKTIIQAGPERAGRALYEKTLKQLEEGGMSPGKAAGLASYLLTEDSAPVTGKLISAVWDDWADLHNQASLTASKDIYTLRRVVREGQT